MRKLLIASHNDHKVEEFQHLLSAHGVKRQVLSLKDIGFNEEINETGTTFLENARIKVNALVDIWQDDVLADDSGFEVHALQGRPGVFSARYAGEHGNHAANVAKVLEEMQDQFNRKAQFQAVLAGRWKQQFFEVNGIVTGHVLRSPKGWGGFGYDPIFMSGTSSRSFAQLSMEEKSLLSHRGRAFQNWISWIRKHED